MKKQLFTLLTLLLVGISSAWADELCSADLSGLTSENRSSATLDATNCTISWDGFSDITNSSNYVDGEDSHRYYKLSNDTKCVTLKLASGSFQVGDVVRVKVTANGSSSVGFKVHSSSNTATTLSTGGKGKVVEPSYTLKAVDIESDGSVKILRSSSSAFMYSFSVSGTRALSISTQPVSAEYVSGAAATALSVVASGGTTPYSYQWYSCDDAEKTNPSEVGTNSSSYTPSTSATGYYYCKVTDSATPTPAEVESNVATITISAASAPTKPTITGTPVSAIDKGTEVTLTASSSGMPAPTYEWFQCDDAEGTNPVSKATTAAYAPSTAAAGTFYFYAVATNSEGSATSDVVSFTVSASSEKELTEVKYSNGFNAFINESAHTVTAYYLAGESAPTVASTEESADATVDTSDADKITVIAEDGSEQDYTVTLTAVTPYSGTGLQFDGTETWIKTGGAYKTTEDDGKGGTKTYYAWVINKQANDGRVQLGRTRIYFFVDKSSKITLTNDRGTSLSSDRAIRVYVNGVEQATPTSMPKYVNAGTAHIDITTGTAAMIEIESNQTSGDTGWGKIAVIAEPSDPVVDVSTVTLATTANMDGWRSYNNASDKKYTVSANTKVYYASATGDSKVTLTEIDGGVPANTVVILHKEDAAGAAANIVLTETDASITAPGSNELQVSTAGQNLGKVYRLGYKSSDGVGFYTYTTTSAPAGIIYVSSVSSANFLSMDFGETTGVESVGKPQTTTNREVYNLAGQRVAQPTKGLYIVNGKKVIVK